MLDLKLPMSYVPADSKAYPLVVQVVNKGGQPRFLSKDVIITLSSSDPTVGYTEPSILLKAGESSTVTTFKSTFIVGSTNLTASASGLTSCTIVVKTVGISGAPTKLVGYILPSKVLAKNGTRALIVVELQDANGFPAHAPEDLTVFLSSSVTSVGIVDPLITIRKNSTFAVAYFYPTNQPSHTEVTVSASGFKSTTIKITTISYNPNKLALYVLPEILPKQSKGSVIVQIQDSKGRPIVATADIKVTLASSNTSIAAFNTNILIINKGESYGRAELTTGNFSASTAVYAAAHGYESANATVSVSETLDAKGGALKLFAVPTILADGQMHSVLAVVMLDDNSTSLVRPPNPIRIYFSSSNTRVGEVTELVFSSKEYAYANFRSLTIGDTTITALADDFNASKITVSVVEQPKLNLSLCICPPIIPVNSPYEPIIVVQAQNEYGEPILASADVEVHLYLSNTKVGRVEGSVYINQSEYYGLSSYHISSELGNATITATASNFASATANIAIFRAGASKISLNIEPSTVIADIATLQNIFVTLQDMYGYPAKAPYDTHIVLSSSNSEIGSLPASLTIPKNETFAYTSFHKSGKEGTTQITAHSKGLQSSAKTLSSILLEQEATISALTTKIYTYDQLTIHITTQFEGQPLSGVDIIWSPSEHLLEASPKSDAQGVANAVFTSSVEGEYTIKAILSKPGFNAAEASLSILVKPRQLSIATKAPLEVRTFEEVNILVKVTEDGKPIEGALVTLKPSQGNIVTRGSYTDVNGTIQAAFRCDEPPKAAIYYTVKKAGYTVSNGSLTFNIKPQPISVALSTNASVIDAGNILEVAALVTSGDKPIDNATLKWDVMGGLVLNMANYSDKQGIGRLTLKSDEDADAVYISVVAAKKGYSSGMGATTIKILPLPLFQSITTLSFWQKNPFVTPFVAALIVVCVLLVRALKKKSSTTKSEDLDLDAEI